MANVTPVVFRVWPKSEGREVIALFPTQQENGGLIGSYEHMGQHGAASSGIVYRTRLAKADEYASLKRELEKIGYVLRVMRRISRKTKGAKDNG